MSFSVDLICNDNKVYVCDSGLIKYVDLDNEVLWKFTVVHNIQLV